MCYHIYIIEVDGIYPEEESMQKSVQDSVQDNGNSGGVFVGEYKPHLKMNLIQMTLPDKPNSRNQRYIKI